MEIELKSINTSVFWIAKKMLEQKKKITVILSPNLKTNLERSKGNVHMQMCL